MLISTRVTRRTIRHRNGGVILHHMLTRVGWSPPVGPFRIFGRISSYIHPIPVEYDDYYKLFNTFRSIISALVAPFLGLIVDASVRFYDKSRPNLEVKTTLVSTWINQVLLLVFGLSLLLDSLGGLWVSMVSFMFFSSWIYVQEALSKFGFLSF